MGRVATRLERVELVLQHQSHLAQQTELVGSRDDHPAPGPDEPSQFPHERTRVLQMLDRLDGHHEIAGSVRQRSPARVQVDSVELSFVRETIIVNDIDSDVSIEPGSQVIPQVTGTAPDIDEDSAPSVPASDGIGDRSVDLLTTNSQTLQTRVSTRSDEAVIGADSHSGSEEARPAGRVPRGGQPEPHRQIGTISQPGGSGRFPRLRPTSLPDATPQNLYALPR